MNRNSNGQWKKGHSGREKSRATKEFVEMCKQFMEETGFGLCVNTAMRTDELGERTREWMASYVWGKPPSKVDVSDRTAEIIVRLIKGQ